MNPRQWLRAMTLVLASALHAAFAWLDRRASSVGRWLDRPVDRLGPYEIECKIGEGAMGEVYFGRHERLGRPTALKILHPHRSGADSVARFEREVRHTAMLTHPNTVAVYDYGRTESGTFYYAMEYLAGVDLQRLVDEHGPLPARRVVHLLLQVCGALAEAHAAGLVHRDIKPANVFLCERGGVSDVIKVLDFGLVKDVTVDPANELTGARALVGTPAYLAPEAIRSARDVCPQSDVYAVGALGYFLLTGTPVFTGRSIVDVLAKHLDEPPPTIRTPDGERIAPALDATLRSCLSKRPAERPHDAGALRRALLECALPPWTDAEAFAWWCDHRGEIDADAQQQVPRAQSPTTMDPTLDLCSASMIRRASPPWVVGWG